MLCPEVGFYPRDPRGSLKGEPGFSQETDICSPALCFKMFLLAVMWEMGEGDRKGLHPMEEGLQQREEGRKNVSDSGYI